MLKNSCKVNVLAALANLFMARHLLLCKTWLWETCAYRGQIAPEMNEILPETQRDWSNDAQTNLKRFTTSKLRFKPVYLSLLLRASLTDFH
jgi:hypothetical protein